MSYPLISLTAAGQNDDLIEVMQFPKLTKYAVVKVGFQIKNSRSSILDFDINTIVRQRLHDFDIPIHDITL